MLSNANSQSICIPSEIKNQLSSGDIIMRKGGGPLSWQLMNISKEDYSHCGVIVKLDAEWWVIQSQSSGAVGNKDGLQITTLNNFTKYTVDSTLFICRSQMADLKNQNITDRAFYYLEKRIPFDHRFNLRNDQKFYCSELLYHIFRDVCGKNIFEIRKQHKTYVLLFSTFFDRKKFEPIFNLKL